MGIIVRLARWAALGIGVLSFVSAPAAAARLNLRSSDATHVAVLPVSVGAAWVDYDASDANDLTGRTPAAADRLVQMTCKNDHATQSLYVLFKAGGVIATSLAQELKSGESYTWTIYGTLATTISLQGSGAATTGRCVLYLEQQ